MVQITRRQFSAGLLAAATARLFGASSIDDTLRHQGIARRKIPCVAAMAATVDKILYTGAFGKRDSASGIDVTPDSIFAIASMTKAITTTAAMQLVEKGKVTLDEPVSKHLPDLAKLDVLEGFDSGGKPILRPARKPVALKHLLTHTSGFAYDTWDGNMLKYNMLHPQPPGTVAPLTPLILSPARAGSMGLVSIGRASSSRRLADRPSKPISRRIYSLRLESKTPLSFFRLKNSSAW
jgi:CubicO group peptidase (beta-lactamase class C family)